MGNSSSSLVDCIHDGDITGLKEALTRLREDRDLERQQDLASPELEDAVHAALSMEVSTAQQFQQLQIALELLLQAGPHVLRTADCNLCGWTALHRACVTGNLSFVPFLYERHAQHLCSARDVFGLTPIDLVPPELATTDAAAHKLALAPPATLSSAYERRLAALHLLRDAKRALQAEAIEAFLPPLPLSEAPSADVELAEDSVEVHPTRPRRASLSTTEFYLALDGHHEHVPESYGDHVHELERPLRLRYRLPRVEAVVHGYFQLIWRGVDDPRSEEPQYDHHVLLRDEMFLDVAAEDLESNQHETRRLDDDAPVLRGCIPISVAHLPDESVCHVLFIASDKHMMKRQILLSTEGVRLLAVHQLGDVEMGGAVDHAEGSTALPLGASRHGGFVFHVAGEEFTHPSEELSGQVFETVEEFEAFVKALRHAKRRSQEPSNQAEHYDEEEADEDNQDQDQDQDTDQENLKERGGGGPLSCDAA